MILVDTSALVRSLTGPRTELGALEALVGEGRRLGLPALVLYEWRRGPRTAEELAVQEALLPSDRAIEFDSRAALLAAELYQQLDRPRDRGVDIAIAATALSHDARLWTFNPRDFRGIEGLDLI